MSYLYETLEDLSRKTSNGSLVICIKETGTIIAELNWEDIVDIEKSLELSGEVSEGNITLRGKYPFLEERFKHFGENIPHALKKFKFLLKYFVGSFDY